MNVIPFPMVVDLSSCTSQEVFTYLDAISRTRALTDAESNRLEKAIRELDKKEPRRTWHWSPEEDARAVEMREQGLSYAQIAKALGRTKGSVLGRLHHSTRRSASA